MNIETEKLGLIHWLTQLTDEKIIARIKALRGEQTDWWNKISAEEKAEIEEGMAQAEREEFTPHNEVMEKYRKWL